tara:strand:- start:22 stop:525 length:504 start_codon:yes stop_codon:yes gene_type:complete
MVSNKAIVKVIEKVGEEYLEEINNFIKNNNGDHNYFMSAKQHISSFLDLLDEKMPSSYQGFILGLDIEQLNRFKEVIEERIKTIKDEGRVKIYAVSDDLINEGFFFDKFEAFKYKSSLIIKNIEEAKEESQLRNFEVNSIFVYKAELKNYFSQDEINKNKEIINKES